MDSTDKTVVAIFASMVMVVALFFGWSLVNEAQQAGQMKACVAAGKSWQRHGDTGDCK